VYQQQQQEQEQEQEQQQDAENPFLDPPFSRIKSTQIKSIVHLLTTLGLVVSSRSMVDGFPV
jgi:hypothetical protein